MISSLSSSFSSIFCPSTSKPKDKRGTASVSSLSINQTTRQTTKPISPPPTLSQQLLTISQKRQINEADISLIVQGFKSTDFSKLKPLIAKILETEAFDQRNAILKAIFKAHAFEDSKALLKKITSLVNLQKVETAVGSEFSNFKGSYETALDVCKGATRTLESKELSSLIKFKNMVKYYLITTLDWFVESVLFITQLEDVTDPDATKFEKQMIAQMRYQAFRDNIAIVSAALIALTLYLNSALIAGIIAGSTLIVLIALYVIYKKYLKPTPNEAHPAINRTADASKGLIAPVYGRDQTVQDVFNTLENNDGKIGRRYPMIRGGTGVGKSEIGNAMALFLTSPDCPEEWRGKKLYVISTADIVTGGGDDGKMAHLHHIRDILAKHEENAILFFTEVHVGFEALTSFLGQELKTLCDGPGGFPYMLFATTEDEYIDNIAQDSAFVRRLKIFNILPTPPEVTEAVISNMMLREAKDLFITPEAIKLVASVSSIDSPFYETFKYAPQPATAISIASEAVSRARHPFFKQEQEALQQLKILRDKMDSQFALERGKIRLPYSEEGKRFQDSLDSINSQIGALENAFSKSKKELNDFRSLVKKASELQEEIEKAAIALKMAGDKNRSSDADLVKFILLLNYLQPAMNAALKEMADSEQLQKSGGIIDEKLMEAVIRDEAEAFTKKIEEKKLALEKAEEKRKKQPEMKED